MYCNLRYAQVARSYDQVVGQRQIGEIPTSLLKNGGSDVFVIGNEKSEIDLLYD